MAGAASGILHDSLARCRDGGLTPAFWWRDDDLVADSPNFRRLATIAREAGIGCLVAAIPALCDEALGAVVDGVAGLTIAQHGFRHQNHEADGSAKSEFGPGRPQAEVYDEICDGFLRLREIFGPRFAPVFVGPWNRCDPVHAGALVDVGLKGWSGLATEPSRPTHPHLRRVDVHLDIVDWSTPKVQPLEVLCDRIGLALSAVDQGSVRRGSSQAPIGVLTHHRVFDETGWTIFSRLMELIAAAGAGDWSSPPELFGLDVRPGVAGGPP